MGLIGRKVKHYKFGEGAITQQDTSYVTVKFMTEAAPKKFQYPPCPLLQWRDHRPCARQQSISSETGKAVCGADRTGVRPNQNLGRAAYLRGRP